MHDKTLFQGMRFKVNAIEVQGKKGTYTREVVVHPGAVVILPLVDKDHIILIKNKRFAVGAELWELPAGTLEKGEKPLETAKRELIEETGYQAAYMEFLTQFYTSPGFCNEVMYAYVAKDLKDVGQALEETEQITVHQVSWDHVFKMAKSGEICDGKTLATLFFFRAYFCD